MSKNLELGILTTLNSGNKVSRTFCGGKIYP